MHRRLTQVQNKVPHQTLSTKQVSAPKMKSGKKCEERRKNREAFHISDANPLSGY